MARLRCTAALSALLVKRCAQLDIRRKQLAALSGVSVQTIARYENGERKFVSSDHLADLAPHLGLSLDEIFEPCRTADTELKTPPVRKASGIPQANATTHPIAVFLAAPMAAVGGDYEQFQRQVVSVAHELMKMLEPQKVFCAHLDRPTPAHFEDESLALLGNLGVLRATKRLIAIYPEERVTSVLIEIGTALGLGIPTLLLVKDRMHLPWVLRGASYGPVLRTIRFRTMKDIPAILAAESNWIRAE